MGIKISLGKDNWRGKFWGRNLGLVILLDELYFNLFYLFLF